MNSNHQIHPKFKHCCTHLSHTHPPQGLSPSCSSMSYHVELVLFSGVKAISYLSQAEIALPAWRGLFVQVYCSPCSWNVSPPPIIGDQIVLYVWWPPATLEWKLHSPVDGSTCYWTCSWFSSSWCSTPSPLKLIPRPCTAKFTEGQPRAIHQNFLAITVAATFGQGKKFGNFSMLPFQSCSLAWLEMEDYPQLHIHKKNSGWVVSGMFTRKNVHFF